MSSDRREIGVVFVHGFWSSPDVWSHFTRLIGESEELGFAQPLLFGYSSPLVQLRPTRRIPSIANAAGSLRTFLSADAGHFQDLVLVAHSQGGLVVQRCLAELHAKRSPELRRIRRVVMFACPNAGSEFALSLRRRLPANVQEKQLRPLNEDISEAQSIVVNQLHVPVSAYAGESDNIVRPVSAHAMFALTGTVPGDHSSIVRPDSPTHRSYTALRKELLTALADADRLPPEEREAIEVDPKPPAPPEGVPAQAPGDGPRAGGPWHRKAALGALAIALAGALGTWLTLRDDDGHSPGPTPSDSVTASTASTASTTTSPSASALASGTPVPGQWARHYTYNLPSGRAIALHITTGDHDMLPAGATWEDPTSFSWSGKDVHTDVDFVGAKHNQLLLLSDDDPGKPAGCARDSYPKLPDDGHAPRKLAVGDRMCVFTADGKYAMVTIQGFSDTAIRIRVDLPYAG